MLSRSVDRGPRPVTTITAFGIVAPPPGGLTRMKRCGDAAPPGLSAARIRSAWAGSPRIARSKGASASRRIASRSNSRMTFQTLPSFSDPVVTPMTAW